MKQLNVVFSLAVAIVLFVLCQQIISNSISNQRNKNDYAELNHVKYGLLSINEWNRQVTVILSDEINKLDLSKGNEKILRKHIEVLLNTLIDKVDKKIRDENAGSAKGEIKQSFIDIFVNRDAIKKGVPEYTDAVMQEITKAKTKRQIKAALKKQLKQYSQLTYDSRETSLLNDILLRTDSKDREEAKTKINGEITVKKNLIFKEVGILIVLALTLFSAAGFSKKDLTPSRYVVLVLTLIALLLVGVSTPMIDMEAKISQMSFMLLGNPVHFENQVLYFQSKSILDVFWIMINSQDIQMKLVGVLLVTFSIIFPLLKLTSTLGYYFDYRHARENPVIKFFVLNSGKWSMADVMVVAIFMAYIGFDGIIANQLGKLNTVGQELVLMTTNGTSLQPGYYLFLTYTLLALFLSELLTKKPHVPLGSVSQ